tara:strand:- start:351 stop:701 length:351 start_codon:yes stop_codon:yes gene_type:complete
MSDDRFHYTIAALRVDYDHTANPSEYEGRSGRVGRELNAWLVAHLNPKLLPPGQGKSRASWKMPHPYLLTHSPSVSDLVYWNAVMERGDQVQIGCAGEFRAPEIELFDLDAYLASS